MQIFEVEEAARVSGASAALDAAALALQVEQLRAELAERTRAHDVSRQTQKMEVMGQLTGGIAHDFNNLLTGIIGSLEMLQRRLAQGRVDEIDRYAAVAMNSANRAAALTRRLLTFSRTRPESFQPVEVNGLVSSMEDLLRRTLSELIELRQVTPGGVWLARCDPGELENALLNLVINARDAMPGGGTLTLETGNARLDAAAASQWEVSPGDYVRIAVTDTGCGMPAEVISHIFEPFYTTKPVGVGTGLGLPMVYSFARQSGGSVTIDSEVGRGTRVSILLPRHDGEGLPLAAPVEEGAMRSEGHGQVVVVVEDEQPVRSLVMDLLQEHGYRAISATDGLAGLAVLNSESRVDLLITDVGLPGLDGVELAKAARLRRPGLRVLFMTGYGPGVSRRSELDDAGIAVLTKPFTVEGLLSRIRSELGPASEEAGRECAGTGGTGDGR